MATHRRTELRRLIVQRLIAANTRAAGQVYPGRLQPATEAELWNGGVVMVFTGREVIDGDVEKGTGYPLSNYQGGARRHQLIDLELFAPAFTDPTPGTDDFNRDAFQEVDHLAREVENALETYQPPGFESAILRLVRSEPEIGNAANGGMQVAKCNMRYQLTYTTPYRECSDPLVDNDSDNIYLRGLYPGGQVIEGCPAGNTGEACPIPDATVLAEGDVTPPEALPVGNQA